MAKFVQQLTSKLRVLQCCCRCQRRTSLPASRCTAALCDEVAGERLQLSASLQRHLASLTPHLFVPQSREDHGQHHDDTGRRQAGWSSHLQWQPLCRGQVKVHEPDNLFTRSSSLSEDFADLCDSGPDLNLKLDFESVVLRTCTCHLSICVEKVQ